MRKLSNSSRWSTITSRARTIFFKEINDRNLARPLTYDPQRETRTTSWRVTTGEGHPSLESEANRRIVMLPLLPIFWSSLIAPGATGDNFDPGEKG